MSVKGQKQSIIEMKKLETKFKSQGDCCMLARSDDYAILERTPTNSQKTIFEVHTIAKNKPCEIMGRSYPAKETIQPASQFGCKAWTKTTKEAAFELFERLVGKGKTYKTFDPCL